MKKTLISGFVLLVFFAACNDDDKPAENNPNPAASPTAISRLNYSVIASFPHNTSYFTEGLQFYKGSMYEGTGNNGESRLIQYKLDDGKVEKQISIDDKYFGEGITILRDTLYQLTWKSKTGFVYSLPNFKKIRSFSYPTEGWGMTTDGKELIVSDGGSNLYFYSPQDFHLIRKLQVTEADRPSFNINELEYIDGFIYANQWQYNYILKINPADGKVVAKADLTDLVTRSKQKDPGAEFLNGIAYDSTSKRIFITGKNWPEIYEVKFQ